MHQPILSRLFLIQEFIAVESGLLKLETVSRLLAAPSHVVWHVHVSDVSDVRRKRFYSLSLLGVKVFWGEGGKIEFQCP